LRRRFQQNQEDCTFTVLALLPTATTNILEAMNTEKITYEIQQMKGVAGSMLSVKSIGSTSPPSLSETNVTEDDGSLQSESGVHASQVSLPPASEAALRTTTSTTDPSREAALKARKTKRQLWDDLTISGRLAPRLLLSLSLYPG
jgi:peroxin-3